MDGEGWMCLADGKVLLKLIRQYLANDGHKVDRCLDACFQFLSFLGVSYICIISLARGFSYQLNNILPKSPLLGPPITVESVEGVVILSPSQKHRKKNISGKKN